jgi:NAD-dependent dihydropyrimidine dehydrogenase PreA subunit
MLNMREPQIDSTKCNGCGLCVSVCEKNGLKIAQGVAIFISGQDCEAVCASGAIGCPYEIVIEEIITNP